jgi:hypothetical protein
MATRMKPDNWDNIPRNVKLAYILYPSQAPAWAQEEIGRRAALEGKQPPSGIAEMSGAKRVNRSNANAKDHEWWRL